MPEYWRDTGVLWKSASPGAMLDNSIVRRDLFFLLALFVGNEPITKLQRKPLSDLFNEFLESEISLRLASTASFLRARDDYVHEEVIRRDDDGIREWANKLRDQSCGTLQKDIISEKSESLVFREACNKIIHSSVYNFDVVGEHADSYIIPTLYLYGFRNGVQWRVVLDVLRYIEIGIDYTEFS